MKLRVKKSKSCFFELGYTWNGNTSIQKLSFPVNNQYWLCAKNGSGLFNLIKWGTGSDEGKLLTVQQLKDLVVLKHNDIQDATHTSCSKFYYLTNNEFYEYIGGKWVNVDEFVDGLEFKEVNHNTEEPMTEDNQRFVDHSDLFNKIRKGEISFDFSEMKTERDEDVVENPQPSKPSDLFKDDCANLNKMKVEWFEKFLHGVKVQCRVIGTKGWQNMTWKSLDKMKLNLEFREKPTTIEVDGMKFDTVDKLTSYLKSMTNLK